MRSLFQTVKTEAPAPEPVPEFVRIAHDRLRETRTIPGAELAEWRSRGWSVVPYGAMPNDGGTPYRDADITDPALDDRALWPRDAVRAAGSQAGQWAVMTSFARQALDTAADQLAARIQRPRIPRENMKGGNLTPSAVRAADMAQNAIVAESVVMLWQDVDELKAQIAALTAGRKN